MHVRDEPSSQRGRLKIFLSAIPGGTGTATLLQAAQTARSRTIQPLVVLLDTPTDRLPGSLLQGLLPCPQRPIKDQGRSIDGIDLPSLLALKPGLAVIENLAHANQPGSRHPFRYQDVAEVLEAGVDVYASASVANLQSLRDIVQQISGVLVNEIIPDLLFLGADEIQLVDQSPTEIMEQFDQGSIHLPVHFAENASTLFRPGNLAALRELAARKASDWMDAQMRAYMSSREIAGPWPARDRVLSCVSSHPLAERVVRAGKRLADDLNSEWFVLYVETPGHAGMSLPQRERLQGILHLAEEMGGQVFQVSDISTADAILRFCREYNITRLVLGKPPRPRWYELLRGSVADQVIRRSRGINLTIISEEPAGRFTSLRTDLRLRSPVWNYLLSTLFVGAASFVSTLLHSSIEPSNLVMIYLAAVILSAVFLGRGPSILASILSVLLFDFLSIEPRLSLTVADTQYLITFLGMLAVGLIISNSAALLRDQVQVLRRREAETSALNSFSRELTGISGHKAIFQSIINHVSRALPGKAIVLLPTGEKLEEADSSPGYPYTGIEAEAASWAYEHQKQAGRDTDTLGNAVGLYLPLQAAQNVIGVLGLAMPGTEQRLSDSQHQLLEGFASLAALAIGRANLAEQASQAQVLQNTERLQSALLNSISHELRTPLATITGALSSLAEQQAPPGAGDAAQNTRRELIQVAQEEARRLNQLVGNLLDMSRLEAGTVRLKLEECDAEDLVATALAQFRKQAQDSPIQVKIQEDLPAFLADFSLVVQVLVNLLDNAVKFSPAGSSVEVIVESTQDRVSFSVVDRGRGIPASDIPKVFDKFQRSQGTSRVAGIGLGLTICKGIIEAHGGSITAENRPGGGSVLRFALPVKVGPGSNDHDR